MGTTMTFFSVMNTGFSSNNLKEKMQLVAAHNKKRIEEAAAVFKQSMPPEVTDLLQKAGAQFTETFGQSTSESHPTMGFCDTARWLPLYAENLCETSNPSEDDLNQLYQIFSAPILAFSIFDSDVLFVSYIDGNQHIHRFIKPNYEEYEEYDLGCYSKEFPEFLLEFCNEDKHEELKAIWNRDGYVFADERMGDVCSLLGIAVLYGGLEIPAGYQPI